MKDERNKDKKSLRKNKRVLTLGQDPRPNGLTNPVPRAQGITINEKVYSEFGKGCKLCGMPLEDESKEFCSKYCRETYNRIHKNKILINPR